MNISHFFGNQDFFQNMVDYMLDDNSVLDIRSRQIDIHKTNTEEVKSSANYYKILNLIIPIGIILIIAISFGLIRKNKYT